jgi:hypothetical protein
MYERIAIVLDTEQQSKKRHRTGFYEVTNGAEVTGLYFALRIVKE